MEKDVKLTNNDLLNNINTFDMDILEKNIENLELDIILSTQKLTTDFIINFILNEKYQKTTKEKEIDFYTILNDQPHISKEELLNKINLA
tara:strand:- start:430 stop:699 length:270 start_codon:yes stop_codon:yes gene_type:complete